MMSLKSEIHLKMNCEQTTGHTYVPSLLSPYSKQPVTPTCLHYSVHTANSRSHLRAFITQSIQPSPFWQANNSSASPEFPAFCGTWTCITVLTKVRGFLLSLNRSMPSIPFHPVSLSSILISSLLPFSILQVESFQQNTKVLLFPFERATCPAHLILLNVITLKVSGEGYKLWICALCTFPQFLVTSSLSSPNIFPSTHPTAEHTQPVALLSCNRPRFTPTTKYRNNFFIFSFHVLDTHLN
jgi:hypothetical protein